MEPPEPVCGSTDAIVARYPGHPRCTGQILENQAHGGGGQAEGTMETRWALGPYAPDVTLCERLVLETAPMTQAVGRSAGAVLAEQVQRSLVRDVARDVLTGVGGREDVRPAPVDRHRRPGAPGDEHRR